MQTHVILFPFKSTNISETLPVGVLHQFHRADTSLKVCMVCESPGLEGDLYRGIEEVTLASHSISAAPSGLTVRRVRLSLPGSH